jgi:hypothetical protein
VSAVWTPSNYGTITDNTGASYNFSGTPRQLTIIPETAVNATFSIRQIMLAAATVGQAFRVSCIFKRRTGKTNRDFAMTATDPGHNTIGFWYLNTATFSSYLQTSTRILSDQRLEDMGSGRFRCSALVKPLTAGALTIFFRGVPLGATGPLATWTGTTADGFEFGSVMCEEVFADTELASWPIHTTTATVTRAAENAAIVLPAGHTYTVKHTYDNATFDTFTAVPAGTYAMPATPSGRAIVTTTATVAT